MPCDPVPESVERVATDVIGAAIEVHKHLGPGFLERIYHEALCFELKARRIPFERESVVVVNYKGMAITGQRIDLIVGHCVVVELKAAARIDLAHEAKVIVPADDGAPPWLLLNFNARTMKEGLKRIVL